jgi:hypothetical protein
MTYKEYRLERFNNLVTAINHLRISDFIAVVQIDKSVASRIENLSLEFLNECLAKARKTEEQPFFNSSLNDSKFFDEMDNITLSGIIRDYQGSPAYANLLQTIYAEIDPLIQSEQLSHIQKPFNLRVVRNKNIQESPYATTKIHTDIWTGDPKASVKFILPILGDIQRIWCSFFEYEGLVPLEKVDDYNFAKFDSKKIIPINNIFQKCNLIIFDAYALHQTILSGPGARLSVDFAAIYTQRHESELSDSIEKRNEILQKRAGSIFSGISRDSKS